MAAKGEGAEQTSGGQAPLLLKYICCRGSSATCVAGRAAVSEPKGAEMLYDVGEEGGDWSEMRNLLRGDLAVSQKAKTIQKTFALKLHIPEHLTHPKQPSIPEHLTHLNSQAFLNILHILNNHPFLAVAAVLDGPAGVARRGGGNAGSIAAGEVEWAGRRTVLDAPRSTPSPALAGDASEPCLLSLLAA